MSYNLGDTVSAVIRQGTYPWGAGDYTVRGFIVETYRIDRHDTGSQMAYRLNNTGIRSFSDNRLTTTRLVLTEKNKPSIQKPKWRIGRISRAAGAHL